MTTIRLIYFNREESGLVRRVEVYKDPQVFKSEALSLIKKYPKARFFVVNATKAKSPPEGHQGAYGKCWCPYCQDDRIFNYDESLNVIKCSICHISERDYFVRKFNPEDFK